MTSLMRLHRPTATISSPRTGESCHGVLASRNLGSSLATGTLHHGERHHRGQLLRASEAEEYYAPQSIYIEGLLPEEKAGKALSKLFTFVAARTIMGEIESYQECAACHDPVWVGLQDALAAGMGENFVEDLLKSEDSHMRMTAIRILEVRNEYMSEAFNWDKMRGAALKHAAEEKERAFGDYMNSVVPGLAMDAEINEHKEINEEEDRE